MIKLFTVYDSKSGTHIPPFSMISTGAAVRGFHTMLNDPETAYAKYPADFTLLELGSYDEETAKFDLYPTHQNLGNGLHVQSQLQK